MSFEEFVKLLRDKEVVCSDDFARRVYDIVIAQHAVLLNPGQAVMRIGDRVVILNVGRIPLAAVLS